MKKVYNMICCGLTFFMILSLMLFMIFSFFRLCFASFYIDNTFFINPLALIVCSLSTALIMIRNYKFSTHHLFDRN